MLTLKPYCLQLWYETSVNIWEKFNCPFISTTVYRIGANRAPLLNRPPPSCTIVHFTYSSVFKYSKNIRILVKTHFLGANFELNPIRKSILKNRTPGLYWSLYGILSKTNRLQVIKCHSHFNLHITQDWTSIVIDMIKLFISNFLIGWFSFSFE